MRSHFHNTGAALCLLAGLFLCAPASAQMICGGDPGVGAGVYNAERVTPFGRFSCSQCHLATGGRTSPPDLDNTKEWQRRFNIGGCDELFKTIRNGRGIMPRYSMDSLSNTQMRNAVAYLLSEAGINTNIVLSNLPGRVTDTDLVTPDQIDENAADGDYTGITAAAENSTLYTLVGDLEGRFHIAAGGDSTGSITVANSSLINYEESMQHVVFVQASNKDGSSSRSFTIRVINVNEITLVDTLPDVDNTVDAFAGAEVQGLLLQATHADGEPITEWTITEGKGTFVFTEDQNSSTQRLRINPDAETIISGRTSVGITAETEHDFASTSINIQINKVEVSATARLLNNIIAEGERTTLVLDISRTLPTEASMIVDITEDETNGLIMLSTDTINFVSGPITVSIPADELSAMLTIRVDDDEPAAAERTAALRVTSDDPRLIDLPPDVMLTIAADAKAEISVDPTMFMLDEEDQPQTIRLTLSPSTAEPVTVTAIVAEDDRDQIALTEDGSQVTQSIVSFDSDAAFTVQAVNDDAAEMEQTYTITLEVTAGHAGLVSGQDEITVTIPENDTPTSAQKGDPAEGAKVYVNTGCGGCHAAGFGGAPILGTGNWQERFNDRRGSSGLEGSVRNGRLGQGIINMPAYEDTLSNKEIRDVVAYLLQEAGVDTRPWAEPPGKVTDTDLVTPDKIAEDADDVAYTGITAAAENHTLYTLVDDLEGRFSIAAGGGSSGRITVADSRLINYEVSTRHVVVVRASNTAGSSTTAFTIRVINVNETTLIDTMPDVDNTVDAIADAEVQGLLLRATHADGETITGWTITEGEETFVFTESPNSSTQKLRIKEGVSPDAGSIDVGVEARTEYDPATQSFSIQIRKVEATVTASLQDGVSTIAEGERTTLVLSMSRTLPTEASMIVDITEDETNGLIMLSTDTMNFVPGPITASIPAGVLSAMLTIRANDDEPAAAERTAALRVTSDDPRLIDLPPDVMLTIAADAKAEISVDPTMFMLDEEGPPQTIRLTLNPSTAEPVTVTAIVAEDDRDQIALTEDGSQVTQSTVSFNNNAAFTVQAVNDDAAEMEQTYTITLEVTAGHADLAQDQNQITVTIPANGTPTLGFDRPSITVQEGMESTVRILIIPALIDDVRVGLSAVGTLDRNDFELPMLPTEINLVSGQESTIVKIIIKDDKIGERKETGTLIIEVKAGFARITD